MRLGEVQGLRGADIRLSEGRILIQEATRRVKSQAAVRMVPIPPSLNGILAVHLARVAPGPADLVFPDAFQRYDGVRRTWNATCAAAGIAGARPHDARHTFAVHAAQVGVPIVRLQKLLGHATAVMTMRYMQHAPEAFLDADAAAIDAHMAGITDREAQGRVTAARRELRRA
jgi:integrase